MKGPSTHKKIQINKSKLKMPTFKQSKMLPYLFGDERNQRCPLNKIQFATIMNDAWWDIEGSFSIRILNEDLTCFFSSGGSTDAQQSSSEEIEGIVQS